MCLLMLSFFFPSYKLVFLCPEKEKMNISPLSPKWEDFRLSLLKAAYVRDAHVSLIARLKGRGPL